MSFINEKLNSSIPAPGHYEVLPKIPKKKDVGKGFKQMRKFMKEQEAAEKQKLADEKARVEDIKGKIKTEVPKYPLPIPQDITTFEKTYQLYNGKEKKGTSVRVTQVRRRRTGSEAL
jgi:Sec-independent protein translocase protein TatA